MIRTKKIISFLLLLLFFGACAPTMADTHSRLDGDHVANITRMFLRYHFSRQTFDDAHSAEMMRRYLRRFDPGHYYFLQSDVDEFNKYSHLLDNQIRRGNIDIAFTVFDRFLMRFRRRVEKLEPVLRNSFDMNRNETFLLARDKAPYPASREEADRQFRKRLKREFLELTLGGEDEKKAQETLHRRYRSLKFRFENFSRSDVVTAFLNAFTNSYDPHSSYMSPDDYENFNISMRLSLEGIGATLRWEDGITIITKIIPGGAASREGTLKPEDKIVAVGQGSTGPWSDVTNRRLIDVVKLIRGHRGSTVRLSFLRRQKGLTERRLEVSIVRDKIILKEGEAKGRVEERRLPGVKEPFRIGVITLPSFYVDFSNRSLDPENQKRSSRDVEIILRRLNADKVDGVILDLRNNGGGGLDEAVSMAGLVLNRGPVVMVKDLWNPIQMLNNPHSRPVYRGPMVVLINRYSASASEIVAGALQDYGRAIVVGDRATFGKGTVQKIFPLPNGMGALKTTVAKFYRPGSSSTQHRGVEADIVLPSLNNHLDIGESSLDNALPWDTVQRSNFRPWATMDAVLPILRESSALRVKNDAYFTQVKKDVANYLRRKNRKAVTLKRMIDEDREAKREAKLREAKKASSGDGKTEKDFPLEETLRIMMDYIRLVQSESTRSIATDGN
ncbi:MAG: carboxy terminal-processing peptidase [bacterium]